MADQPLHPLTPGQRDVTKLRFDANNNMQNLMVLATKRKIHSGSGL